jgi:hypothetical protein
MLLHALLRQAVVTKPVTCPICPDNAGATEQCASMPCGYSPWQQEIKIVAAMLV